VPEVVDAAAMLNSPPNVPRSVGSPFTHKVARWLPSRPEVWASPATIPALLMALP
jgi:hypothetical protein